MQTIGCLCGTCGGYTASLHRVSWCRDCRALFDRGAPLGVVSLVLRVDAGSVRVASSVAFEGEWDPTAREQLRASIEDVEPRRAGHRG